RLEAVKGAAEVVALAQDRDPGQPGLKAVEHQFLEQRAIIVLRHAPFLVVIGDVQRILLRPGAADEAVGMAKRSAHRAALPSPGKGKRAQDGLTSRISASPAISGSPAASASAVRSRRRSASPRPCAVEPSVPRAFSPALTGVPTSGAKPS